MLRLSLEVVQIINNTKGNFLDYRTNLLLAKKQPTRKDDTLDNMILANNINFISVEKKNIGLSTIQWQSFLSVEEPEDCIEEHPKHALDTYQ